MQDETILDSLDLTRTPYCRPTLARTCPPTQSERLKCCLWVLEQKELFNVISDAIFDGVSD